MGRALDKGPAEQLTKFPSQRCASGVRAIVLVLRSRILHIELVNRGRWVCLGGGLVRGFPLFGDLMGTGTTDWPIADKMLI
jgi:hypothetical protein